MIDRLDAWESALVHIVAKIAPWTAPLPTAYLIWEKTVIHFRWPWVVGLLAAIPVEVLGLVTVKLALDLYAYNRAKRKTDPAAPLWIGSLLVAGYLLVALLLTLGLHITSLEQPTFADWSLALFPFLSLVAFGAIALRTDHAQRLLEVAEAAQERKQQRVERKQQRTEPVESKATAFSCPLCDFAGKSQNSLNAHMIVHKNGREREAVKELEAV